MGGVWAALYVLGFVMPGLFLVASTVAVFRLARRLRQVEPEARPPWQYLAFHLGLGMGLALPLGPIAAVAFLVVPAHLYWARRLRDPSTASSPVATHPLTSANSSRRNWGLAALFSATGVLLPWATGFGVKMYLDAQGRPTLPIEGFVDPASVAIEILLTLSAWAFPFVVLASAVVVPWRVGFSADAPERDSLLPVWISYAAGVVAAVPVFTAVFWVFDSMMLLVPVGLILVLPMALGYYAGWWWLRRGKLEPRKG